MYTRVPRKQLQKHIHTNGGLLLARLHSAVCLNRSVFFVYIINCTVYTIITVQWLVGGFRDQGKKGVCIGKKVHCGPVPYMLKFLQKCIHTLVCFGWITSKNFAPTSTKQSRHYSWKVLHGTYLSFGICSPVGHVNCNTGLFSSSRPRAASCMRKVSFHARYRFALACERWYHLLYRS